jgi:hypothetical protein
MSEKLRIPPIGSEFRIKEYVDTAADAAGLTRTVTVILTVACVVIFVGFWNSLHSSWAAERVRAAYGENISIFNVLESDSNHPNEAERDKYRESLRDEVLKTYINNTRFIKIPFFEIAIDINDLGLMGGGALVIIMLLFAFCLSREIRNLNLSFREAFYHEELKTFYHALAMREVFTVPEISSERQNPVLVIAPKLLCVLPLTILTLTVFYDIFSIIRYRVYVFTDVSSILFFETSVLVPILWWISLTCLEKQFQIDMIWGDFWEIIKTGKTAKSLLRKNSQKSPQLVEILDRRLYKIEENKSLLSRVWNHIKNMQRRRKPRIPVNRRTL